MGKTKKTRKPYRIEDIDKKVTKSDRQFGKMKILLLFIIVSFVAIVTISKINS